MDSPRHFSSSIQKAVALDYLWFQPEEVSRQNTWPLVLFLHGADERGSDVSILRRHGIPRVTAERTDWPFFACSPQCPADENWHVEADAVTALLDHLIAKAPIDPARVYRALHGR